MKKKIGIMGGSFDPIHTAHLLIAESAREQLELDEIWFMPNANPPHKQEQEVTDASLRCEMVEYAIADNPYFTLCRYEAERSEISYTADTLAFFHEKYPNTDWYFLMGGDSIRDFSTWYHPERIAALAVLVIANREELQNELLQEAVHRVKKEYHARVRILSFPELDVSSSMIREKVRMGKSIRYLLPKQAEEYIMEHGLYRA
jgi:nicotinate-nucleotide adenylyltransferase